MKLKEYHFLKDMERIASEDLPELLDQLFERMKIESVGFVVTENGNDSYVLCPCAWLESDYETISVEVDVILLEQLKEIITPMGLTPEDVIQLFFQWLIAPETRETAVAWLLEAKAWFIAEQES